VIADDQKSSKVMLAVTKAILEAEGPFTSVSIVQKSTFSHGKNRPSASKVIEVMSNLECDGLGKVKTVDRTTVFYKELPTDIKKEALNGYSVTKEHYSVQFVKGANVDLLSKDLFNKILRNAPKVQGTS